MAKRLKNRLLDLLTDKEKKEQRRISQAEVARAIKVTPSTISGWIYQEVGKIDSHVLIGLCDYFGVTFNDILYVEEIEDAPAPNEETGG